MQLEQAKRNPKPIRQNQPNQRATGAGQYQADLKPCRILHPSADITGHQPIFDMNELLKFVNDVIIGVMGVFHSTIALCHNLRII